MSTHQFSALLGFGFALIWITLGFGDAVLCLAASGASVATLGVVRGEIDLAELRDRLASERETQFPDAPSSRGRRVH